ncbi:MAG: DNA-processing protein DprA [Oscillospiraceae bacterium]|nr:DNA-processing protein DprA [Oscillospiraceae bacterium]
MDKWIWLSEATYKGNRKVRSLISYFGDAEAIFRADRSSLQSSRIPLTEKELSALLSKDLSAALKILSDCQKEGIRIIPCTSKEFPKRLLEIPDCPTLLYAKGKELSLDDEPVIAVVGTRKASAQGRSAASKISAEIAASGGVLCSGMARGIDTIAMESALNAGGKVIGVLGCGLDICYPAENKNLMKQVEFSGTILSEYPPKTPPDRFNFPKRNRIVSAISLGTVVIEAPEKSGALITARQALEQNRDVFAVPSGIFEASARGSNNLIREGAVPILSGHDVMAEYSHLFPDKINITTVTTKETDVAKATPELKESFALSDEFLSHHSPDEQAILQAISADELRLDEIAAKCDIPIAKLLSLVTMLEIRGSIKKLSDNRFKISF